MKYKTISLVSIFLITFTTFVNNTIGDSADIVISEIAWMGTKASSRDEWMELYNNSESQIDVTGWVLKTSDNGVIITLIGLIPAKSFYLIERNDDEVVKDVKADLIENFGKGFSNNGEKVELYDSAGQLIDFVDASDGWPQGKASPDYKTMERIDMDRSSVLDNWKTNDGLTVKGADAEDNIIQGTPTNSGSIQIIPTESGDEDNNIQPEIIISEIFPNPQGSDKELEFIELYNKGEMEIDLRNWALEDKTGSRYVVKQKDFNVTSIQSQGYFVLYRKQTDIALNNSGGDMARLFNPEGDMADEIFYDDNADEQKSLNRDLNTDELLWSEILTPGAASIISKTNQPPKISFSAIQDGLKVKLDASDSIDPDGDVLQYAWNFGDGEAESGEFIEHNYTESGKYKIKLEISDGINKVEDVKEVILDVPISQKNYSDQVIINEIFPNPKGSDLANEWIELYNKSSKEIALDGWMVGDSGVKSRYKIPEGTKIQPGSFLVLKRVDTKIAINNTGDEIKLFHPDENLLDLIRFNEGAKEDYSYNRNPDDTWAWSEKMTPGTGNIIEIHAEDETKDTVSRSKNGIAKKVKTESIKPKKEIPLSRESKPIVYANNSAQEVNTTRQNNSALPKEDFQISKLADTSHANTHSEDVNLPLNASIATALNSKDSALILVAITFAGFIGSVGGVVFGRKIK